jgi:hypothetical protein
MEKSKVDAKDKACIDESYRCISSKEIAKMSPGDFRSLIYASLNTKGALFDPTDPSRILSALNAEGKPNDKDLLLSPSDFSFSNANGGQFLIKDFLNLASLVSEEAIRYTIENDPRRNVWVTSLNWDPLALRSYAHQWSDPSTTPKETDVAANALAFIGLLSFPVMPSNAGNSTTGFDTATKSFIWPVWERSIPLRVVDSLLATLHPSNGNISSLGVTTCFKSIRFSANKRFYFLKSEEL